MLCDFGHASDLLWTSVSSIRPSAQMIPIPDFGSPCESFPGQPDPQRAYKGLSSSC